MGLNVLGYQSHLPQRCRPAYTVVTKDIFLSPRFSHYDIFRDASSALFQLVNQWLNFTDARIKILLEQESNSRLPHLEGIRDNLLDHSGNEGGIKYYYIFSMNRLD